MMKEIACPNCELKFQFIDEDVNHQGRIKAAKLIREHGITCPYCGVNFQR